MGRGKTNTARGKKNKSDTFKNYTYKVLKQVHPNQGITKEASLTLSFIVEELESAIMEKAYFIMREKKKKVLTAKIIQEASIFVLSGELYVHSVSDGKRALKNFFRSNN